MKAGNQDVLKSVFLPGMLLLCSLTGLLMEGDYAQNRVVSVTAIFRQLWLFQCGCPQRCPKCRGRREVGIAGVEALLASSCVILNAAERRYSSDNARFPRPALRLDGRSLVRTGKGVLQWSRILRT